MLTNLTLSAFRVSKILIKSTIYSRIYHVYSKFNRFHFNLLYLSNKKLLPYSVTSKLVLRHFTIKQTICWNCGKEHDAKYFCSNCNVLQKVETNQDYFSIIGIEQKYNIDTTELTQKYRKLQIVLHPDKFSTKSDQEKLLSEKWSSIVNKAYGTLQNPLKRGLYLLELNGESIESTKPNSNFLLEIMNKHEEAEAATDLNEIERLYNENLIVIEDLTKKVTSAFSKNDVQTAKKYLAEMKYYDTIHQDLREKIQEIEEVNSKK